MRRYKVVLVTAIIGFLSTTANAVPVLCETTTNNHMFIDSTQVSACVAAGTGNINQNPLTDDFLTSVGTAAGYVGAGVASSFTQTQTPGTTTGTWSIDSAVDAIGFKFGTGNQPDEWFIFDLVAGVTSGTYEFINVFGRGGGLSHMETYNKTKVPEPGMVALLAIGLLGIAVARRRTKV